MKSLTKFLLAVAVMAVAQITVAKPDRTVAANASEIVDRHLSGFNAINVAGSFDVQITQGPIESVKVQAPADMMDRIKTEVYDGVLKIYNKHDTFDWSNLWGHHKKIIVYVIVKDLNSIDLSGSGDAWFKDGITANSLKLHISGSGDMTGKVEVKTLESSISGSGDMKLSGHAENSAVTVVGSGNYTARNLLTMSCAVRVTGSGDAQVNASERVDAAISGSGDIRYTGAAKVINSRKTGSGDVSRF